MPRIVQNSRGAELIKSVFAYLRWGLRATNGVGTCNSPARQVIVTFRTEGRTAQRTLRSNPPQRPPHRSGGDLAKQLTLPE